MNTLNQDIIRRSDESALRLLSVKYARCVDGRDGPGFAALFAPGGALEAKRGKYNTPEMLAQIAAVNVRVYEKTYHTILNCSFEIDGDRATGEIYSMTHNLVPSGNGESTKELLYMTYRDNYVRGASGWLFECRRVEHQFSQWDVAKNCIL